MVIHLVEAVRSHHDSPCWASSFEQLWGRLPKWMTLTSRPEPTMVNAWQAFITC